MDKDGSGTMSIDEFRDALTRMGMGLTAVQVGEVLAAVDADGNGTVEVRLATCCFFNRSTSVNLSLIPQLAALVQYDEFIGLLGVSTQPILQLLVMQQ